MNTICFISGGVAELVVQKFGSYLLHRSFSKDMKPIKMHVQLFTDQARPDIQFYLLEFVCETALAHHREISVICMIY